MSRRPVLESLDREILDYEIPLEPERYELRATPTYCFEVDRRDFFKFMGAGILIVCALKGVRAQESGSRKRPSDEDLPQDIGGWLHLGENGTVTVYTGKVEVGQNIRTSSEPGGCRGVARSAEQNPNGHGGHAAHSLRYGDVWEPDYAHHESTTPEGGRGRSRVADRFGGQPVES